MASKTIPTKESPYLLGETMKGTLKLVRVLFPRKQLSEIIPGEFGILIMEVQSVEEGAVPTEIAMGTSVIKPLITIKGSIPAVEYETLYNFAGTLIEDARFGLQYTIEKLERPFSFETDDQKDLFLRTIFGDSKTDLLYDALPDPMDVLEREDIDALVKVKGIGRKTAEKLLARFRSKIGDSSGLVQLQEYGLTPNMIVKLQEIFHSVDTILYLLQNNPYALIDLVEGISWITADKLALNSGYNPISGKRIAAYTQYYLKDMAQSEGHSYISLDELVGAIYSIAPKIDEDDLRNMLHAWIQDGWLYYEAETRRIGLTYYRKLEEQITLELMRLQHSKTRTYTEEEVNRAISEAEAEYGIEYTDEQRSGIDVCLKNNVSIVSGAAGVGKSTVVAPLVRLFKQKQIPFAQCSLSGKAASNLSDITGEEGYTIHRLLSYDGLTGNFLYNKQNNVPYGVIILDELSLVGGEIFLKLLQAIPSGSSLIMLGDPNQLEAIGLTNLLKDCLDSYVIPSAKLTKIHRQAARSGIITESLRVSAGENIVSLEPIEETRGVLKDLKIKTYLESGESQRAVFNEYKKLVDEGVYPDDITVVVPMRTRGDISCFELNGMIQEYINPGNNFLRGVTISTKEGGYILREGDRVLVTKNNYRTQNLSGDIVPVYNGNIGKIRTIDAQAGNIVVRFRQQGDIVVPREFWRTLELGYAITCHKFQGSASPYVIVGLDMSAYTLLSKEWLYTALTRARKYCVLVGQINAIRKSVKISRVTVKRTWLQELLIYATQAILEDKPISFNFVDNINTYWWTPQELQRAMEMKREEELKDAEEEDD